MKIFAYVSSYRQKDSECLLLIKKIIDNINEEIDEKNEIVIKTASSFTISECIGCLHCFHTGYCGIKDDMECLKKELESSDLIIIASPVFAHNVTGNLKNIIDRLTYWVHLMHLKGKLGINIVVSSSNGNSFVSNYLSKIMEYLGISVLAKISITYDIMSKEAINSVIDVESKNLISKIRKKTYEITQQQEEYFSTQKWVIQNHPKNSFERKYWEEKGYLNKKNYREVFDQYFVLKNKGIYAINLRNNVSQ